MKIWSVAIPFSVAAVATCLVLSKFEINLIVLQIPSLFAAIGVNALIMAFWCPTAVMADRSPRLTALLTTLAFAIGTFLFFAFQATRALEPSTPWGRMLLLHVFAASIMSGLIAYLLQAIAGYKSACTQSKDTAV